MGMHVFIQWTIFNEDDDDATTKQAEKFNSFFFFSFLMFRLKMNLLMNKNRNRHVFLKYHWNAVDFIQMSKIDKGIKKPWVSFYCHSMKLRITIQEHL